MELSQGSNSASASSIFDVREVVKRYVTLKVLDSISLQLFAGDKVLLLGANGSGKSTLLRVMAGLSRPDAGVCTVLKAGELGHAGHELFLYGDLSVQESLVFAASLIGSGVSVDDMMAAWALSEHKQKRINELSRGLQSRVSLARALLHDPKFIFLDEPTSALDDESVRSFCSDIARRVESSKGAAVIVSHDVQRLGEWCNRAVFLRDGKIFADSRGRDKAEIFAYYREGNR